MSNRCKILRNLLLASFLMRALTPGAITAQESKSLDPVLVAKAQAGDVNAQYKLAVDYYIGQHGAPRNYEQAAAWARKAAEQGDPGSQTLLGALYTKGDGVPQSYTQSIAWYRKAAEQGSPWAQTALGEGYLNGEGVHQDYAQAMVTTKARSLLTPQTMSKSNQTASLLSRLQSFAPRKRSSVNSTLWLSPLKSTPRAKSS